MMDNSYDIIIWGSSIRGIARAAELKKSGKRVLLASRFGFPGGRHTESLSVLFSPDNIKADVWIQQLIDQAAKLKFGILHQSNLGTLLHPEAVKRICWHWLAEFIPHALFHVIPLDIEKHKNGINVRLFGREGEISISAADIEDHADNIPLTGIDKEAEYNMLINGFFIDSLPFTQSVFNITRMIETPIGQFVTHSVRKIPAVDLDNVFNRELNRLTVESWSRYQNRISIIPVYPEIVINQHNSYGR